MLNQLAVVKFYGNLHGIPISKHAIVTIYMVYHVSSLKALDGACSYCKELSE